MVNPIQPWPVTISIARLSVVEHNWLRLGWIVIFCVFAAIYTNAHITADAGGLSDSVITSSEFEKPDITAPFRASRR